MSHKDDFVEEIPARELPLSTVESTPPLMLDLPDGQQLVVGKLPDGIVIEIATWRGTGRPDSRTNRMMLGVSYDEDETEEKAARTFLRRIKPGAQNMPSQDSETDATVTLHQSENESDVIAQVPGPEFDALPAEAIESALQPEIVAELVDRTGEIQIQPIDPAPNDEIEQIAQIVEQEIPVFLATESTDLNKNMQDLFGARPRTEINDENPSFMIDRSHEIVSKRPAKSRQIERKRRGLAITSTTLLIIGAATYLLVGPGAVRFTLPEDGIRTSMSSAANALVIVRELDNYQIGDAVVASVQAPGSPDYFASIAAQSESEFILTENSLYHTAAREDVKGRVLLVMPGIGFVLNKLGF